MPTISRWCACLSWALWLFQFCEDFIGTHTAGQQLLQHFFGLCLLCFFGSLGVCDRLFRSKEDNSFWAVLRAAVFSFRSAFRVSMFAVIEVISDVRQTIDSCFSVIRDAKSVVSFDLFLLPFVLGTIAYLHITMFSFFRSNQKVSYQRSQTSSCQ